MRPPRPRAPSLTDSLKDMSFPSESGSDAAVRKAFAQPEAPVETTWNVDTHVGREQVKAQRMQLTDAGALAFQSDNVTWLILAPGTWLRATRA